MASPTAVHNLSRLLCKPQSHLLRHHSTSTSSVSASELLHFSTLASTWWDPHGSSRLLHLMNPLRHDFIASCLASTREPLSTQSKPVQPGFKYLDIGCGGGIFAESIARHPSTTTVTAIDPSSSLLSIAKAHARQDPLLHQSGRLDYLNASIEDLPVPQSLEDQFDILTLFEVLEHVHQPSTFLSTCLPFVKPGGWIIGSTIARTWTSWVTTKLMAENVLRIVPEGTHEWAKYVNAEELEKWFALREGWQGREMRKMGLVYMPGLGWRNIQGGELWGNYFFGVRRDVE